MLAAIFIALGFLSRPAHEWAAVIGGIGFGAFIDEMGKFITNDNNYFLRANNCYYLCHFHLDLLAIRGIFYFRPMTRYENLANAFELMKQGSINGLNSEDEQTILNSLEHCDPTNPLVIHLREMLPHIRIVPSRQPYLLNRFKHSTGCFLPDGHHPLVVCWSGDCLFRFYCRDRFFGVHRRHQFTLEYYTGYHRSGYHSSGFASIVGKTDP